jgi:hypothetical protein
LPDWLIERGIGETRAVLIEAGKIIEARIHLEGAIAAGSIVTARLTAIGDKGRNAVATDAEGREYLLATAPRSVTQGAQLPIEVTREAIPGAEPWKRPIARAAGQDCAPAPASEGDALSFPAAHDRLAELGWWDLLDEARSGIVAFSGGELRIHVTPAMTLIDVDGTLGTNELALAGVRSAARAIRRHGIGGSIGIDLPTVQGKAQRQALGEAFDAGLPQPFERTAVNGFGFLQVVRPRRHASLFELASDRAAFEARALLRTAAFEPAGAKTLVAHPAVAALLQSRSEWLDSLARQIGGAVTLRSEPSLPIHGGYAQG